MSNNFQPSNGDAPFERTAYDFSFKALADQTVLPISDFKDKFILIVNTASRCGFTPQYGQLERLYNDYKDKGFVVICVPSNDFGAQEPGNEETIANFCHFNYKVTFPMTSKEKVSGDDAHPFYAWAKKVMGFGTSPKWNFHKYLIDREGKVIDYFYSITSPNSPRLIKAIEKTLSER